MQMQQQMRAGRRTAVRVQAKQAVSTGTRVVIKDTGVATLRGTIRKINEDRSEVRSQEGGISAYAAVYDGHGGPATAEWLTTKLFPFIEKSFNPLDPRASIKTAFLQADKKLLSASSGFMGMGERGVGGSKCGATAAAALVYQDPRTNSTRMLAANVGDARVVVVSTTGKGPAEQLTVDHVPDDEVERARIEKFNPNPKLPLVRYVSGTWRVGGLLALSRAFGDAYMKGSSQFEGMEQGTDGYSSGFGVIAEPHSMIFDLPNEDCWVVVSSDGLYAEEERGGGGGLDNVTVADILRSAGPGTACGTVAQVLAKAAVEVGSTDDVTVIVLRVGPA